MLSEIGIWLWAAKLRDTTKESFMNPVVQQPNAVFQSLSGGFLSPGSLVVKEVWGATNDSMFLAAACCLQVLQDSGSSGLQVFIHHRSKYGMHMIF